MSADKVPVAQADQTANVDQIVQEYMDTLLADLFPEVQAETAQTEPLVRTEEPPPPIQTQLKPAPLEKRKANETKVQFQEPEPVKVRQEVIIQDEVLVQEDLDVSKKVNVKEEEVGELSQKLEQVLKDQKKELVLEEVELRYPLAPAWAQQTFDVLLFNVCGLKLAVSMES